MRWLCYSQNGSHPRGRPRNNHGHAQFSPYASWPHRYPFLSHNFQSTDPSVCFTRTLLFTLQGSAQMDPPHPASRPSRVALTLLTSPNVESHGSCDPICLCHTCSRLQEVKVPGSLPRHPHPHPTSDPLNSATMARPESSCPETRKP